MPFRRRFACLWCGRDWEVRTDEDLEGWAALCPDCLGKADDNGFLRDRLRTALRDRSAAIAPPPPVSIEPPAHDDWYLRRGQFSRGPLHDGPWGMELDEVTRWLDAIPMGGVIVELAAGTGWWSTLLAEKGELWIYDADGDALDAARKRLMAHGLLAHIHQQEASAPADKQVDVVVASYLLGASPDEDHLAECITTVRGWLKPGGTFVFIEPQLAATDRIDGPAGPLCPRSAEALGRALEDCGLVLVEVGQTQRAFVMGRAQAPA